MMRPHRQIWVWPTTDGWHWILKIGAASLGKKAKYPPGPLQEVWTRHGSPVYLAGTDWNLDLFFLAFEGVFCKEVSGLCKPKVQGTLRS
jgi:hypothetical protein